MWGHVLCQSSERCTCMLTRLSHACRRCTLPSCDNKTCRTAVAMCPHIHVRLVTHRLHRGGLVSVRCPRSMPEVECCLPCCVPCMVSGTAAAAAAASAAHMAHSLPTSAACASRSHCDYALQTGGSLQMQSIRSAWPTACRGCTHCFCAARAAL